MAKVMEFDSSLIHENPDATLSDDEELTTNDDDHIGEQMYRRGHDRRVAEFPKLTDQHLLNAFYDSGVTNNHINQLGIRLGLSQDTMHRIRMESDNGPPIFAMNTINTWLKKDPKRIGDDIQQTYVELEDKLRQVHLNCVIGRLRKKETQCVAPDLTDLVGKTTVNITRDEAIDFGAELGLTYVDIQDVINETGIARGPYVALALYKEAERRHTFIDHSFVKKVTSVLGKVRTSSSSPFDNEKECQLRERAEVIEENSLNNLPQIQTDVIRTVSKTLVRTKTGELALTNSPNHTTPDDEKENATVERSCFVYTKRNFCIGSLGCVAIVLLISLLPMPIFYSQELENFPEQEIAMNDETIKYELSDSETIWLNSLDLELVDLELVGDDRCLVDVLTTECEAINTTVSHEELQLGLLDYIYLSQGATVEFKQNQPPSAESSCYPKYIWIFNNLNDAERNLEENFERLACLDPPEGTTCLTTNTTNMTATASSYYFIRCFNDPDCSFLSNLTIVNNTLNNFDATEKHSIDSQTIRIGFKNANLKVQKNIMHPQLNSICVLMRLQGCNDSFPHHIILSGKRSKGFLVYSFLFCIFNLILAFICLAVTWMICTKQSQRIDRVV